MESGLLHPQKLGMLWDWLVTMGTAIQSYQKLVSSMNFLLHWFSFCCFSSGITRRFDHLYDKDWMDVSSKLGYNWLLIMKDAANCLLHCASCQFYQYIGYFNLVLPLNWSFFSWLSSTMRANPSPESFGTIFFLIWCLICFAIASFCGIIKVISTFNFQLAGFMFSNFIHWANFVFCILRFYELWFSINEWLVKLLLSQKCCWDFPVSIILLL